MSNKQVLFIAEFACIHEGDKEYLLELARAVRQAGGNAVKFQVFNPEEVVARIHPDFDYLDRIAFSETEWSEIIRECCSLNIDVWIDVSGPFSVQVARSSHGMVAGVKIHSSDVDNPIVIESVKKLELPVAIGCGGTSLVDLFGVMDVLGSDCPVILMHGYQAFPKLEGAKGGPPVRGLQPEELELWRMRQLLETFPHARIGLADHLSGDHPMATQVPAIAAALGATVIEKHVTLRRSERREDYFSSLEPHEFKRMVELVQNTVAAVGVDLRQMGQSEIAYQREMKRTVQAARMLPAGAELNADAITLVRDGSYGGSVRASRLIGRRLREQVTRGTRLTDAHVEQKVGVFCNARLASSRLPQKALLPFFERYTTVGYLLNRLISYQPGIGEVVLATTDLIEDDVLETIAGEIGVPCFRGEPEDVMGRMVQTADAFGWDVLVRVTGDDLFVSCEYIAKALRYHLEKSLDYTRIRGLPVGMACEVIDVRTLGRIHRAVVNRKQTEHLTWYLDSEWVCRNGVLEAEPQHRYEHFRVTLDYHEDYELMREIARRCHAIQNHFYVPTECIIRQLIEIDPKWIDHPTLWPLPREAVNTKLIYNQFVGQ